jgi:very-short-patch-repair endonuclease
MASAVDSSARSIASIAGRQRGVVTRSQLRQAGLSEAAISRQLGSGRLHLLHRGVYLVGHAVPPPLARELAALLACGPTAALSHQTAAAFWRILPSPDPTTVHVTVPDRRCRPRPGLRTHAHKLDPADTTTRHGLRLTTPARTLQDLTPLLDPAALERATNEAQVLGLQVPHRTDTPGLTRSEAERRLLDLLRRAGLPPTATNAKVAGHEVDVLYEEERLIVEVDGYAFHRTRAAFERDRRRDADLVAAGCRVMRVTWRQLCDEREALVVRLARSLP